MRRLSVVLALALLGLLGAAPAVQAAPSSVFTGEWIATDRGDASTEHLVVGPGPRPQILFTDEEATGGVCDGIDSKYFTSLLTGSNDGDTLNATFVVAKCGHVTVIRRDAFGAFPVSWTLLADGTLLDSFGDTWSRA
jgi:hypothetical protein